jgi:uncharacterized membrane protein
MATLAAAVVPARRAGPLAVGGYDRVLAAGASLIFVAATVAVLRGRADWAHVPPLVWAHLLAVLVATGLTPVMLLRRRGDARHRLLGRVWLAAMLLTAGFSFGIQALRPGHFSLIHVLSAWTLIQVPLVWWTARRHQVLRHRRMVRSFVTGALVIAGLFTFPFDRLLGRWLFG